MIMLSVVHAKSYESDQSAVLPIVIVSGKHIISGYVSLGACQDRRCCFPEQTLPTGNPLHKLPFTVQSWVSITSFHYRFQSSL